MKILKFTPYFLISILLLSCSDENETAPTNLPEILSIGTSQELKDLKNDLDKSISEGRMSDASQDLFETADWTSVLKVVDENYDYTAYGLNIPNSTESKNLVVFSKNEILYAYESSIEFNSRGSFLALRPILDHGNSNGRQKMPGGAVCTLDGVAWIYPETELEIGSDGSVTVISSQAIPIYIYECSGGGTAGSPTGGDSPFGGNPGGTSPAVPLIPESACSMDLAYQINSEGECVQRNPFKVCASSLDFQLTGEGFTAEITSLGALVVHDLTLQSVNVELGVVCVTLPANRFSNRYDAAAGFAAIMNYTRDLLDSKADAGELAMNAVSIRNEMISIINSELNNFLPGSTFSTGPCSGNIPTSVATYDIDC
ncbi:MAG: hypothetical protein RIM99_17940 [Cyclobacteriaceae bacterium]